MDEGQKLEKLARRVCTLSEMLDFICPSISITRLRQVTSPVVSSLSVTKRMNSLTGRVFAASWAGFGSAQNPEALPMLATATDEGEITIWHSTRGKALFRTNVLSEEPGLLTCSFERREGSLLASGGLEGRLYLFRLSCTSNHEMALNEHPLITIFAHSSYISKCAFLSCNLLLSASGDHSCRLWDLANAAEPLKLFEKHTEDVMSLAVTQCNPSIFVSGSCDATIRVWDVREQKSNVCSYYTHVGHVNAVRFMRESENTFAAGSSSGTCRLFDLRTLREVGSYYCGKDMSGVTDLEFSSSGRMMMCADDRGRVKVWDLFDERLPVQVLQPHEEQINGIELSPNGDKVCCCSSDCSISLIENVFPGD
jgi:guanine nucleotide-binding protein G(I)/G(S)/G(T) subunit beta-1